MMCWHVLTCPRCCSVNLKDTLKAELLSLNFAIDASIGSDPISSSVPLLTCAHAVGWHENTIPVLASVCCPDYPLHHQVWLSNGRLDAVLVWIPHGNGIGAVGAASGQYMVYSITVIGLLAYYPSYMGSGKRVIVVGGYEPVAMPMNIALVKMLLTAPRQVPPSLQSAIRAGLGAFCEVFCLSYTT